MSNQQKKVTQPRPAAPQASSPKGSAKDPSGRAAFDALRERVQRLASKDPAKAATILTGWLNKSGKKAA